MTEPLSGAERARRLRDRRRGGPPRTVSDDPLARARRKLRRGFTVDQLDPAEADALRRYKRDHTAAQRRTNR